MRLTPFPTPPALDETTLPALRVLLEIRRGAARHKLRPVAGPVYLIGRSDGCDLVLADPQFPEIHAYLLISEGRVLIRRLGEGPEITVDGRPIEAAELFNGDRLRTGPFEFRLHLDASPDGPDGKAAEDRKPQPVRRTRVTRETPLEAVRALLADVRALLASAGQHSAPPAAQVQRGASSTATTARRDAA